MNGAGEPGMGPCGSQKGRRVRSSQLTAVSLSPAFPSTLMSLLPLPDDILPFLEGTAQKFPLPTKTRLFPRLSPRATLSGSLCEQTDSPQLGAEPRKRLPRPTRSLRCKPAIFLDL